MTEKSRKIKYWVCKVLSVLVSCGLPMYSINEHFPIWTESFGTVRSIGAGGIIAIIVAVIIFRKSVFGYIRDKMKLRNAPPLAVWPTVIAILYGLLFLNQFIRDLITVCWMGFAGCAIGTLLTYIAENWYGKKKEDTDGRA